MDILLQRYLSTAVAFEKHDTTERVVLGPHGATEATTSDMLNGTSQTHNGSAAVATPLSSTPADFISRDRYPLSPKSSAAFLAIASHFDPPPHPEVFVSFESCPADQAAPPTAHHNSSELHSTAGPSSGPTTTQPHHTPPAFSPDPPAAAEPMGVEVPISMQQAAAGQHHHHQHQHHNYQHQHHRSASPAPAAATLELVFGSSGHHDASCRQLAGASSADVLLDLAMDLATPGPCCGALGINWPSPHAAGLSKNPFSRSGSRDTSERQPACPGGREQEPLEQYASDDVMDDDEGVELEGGLMCVQGRGVSRAPQDEALPGVRPGGLSL
ncbi:MAG: hypothetical protein WDW38_003802 [Sanguina aurantia]